VLAAVLLGDDVEDIIDTRIPVREPCGLKTFGSDRRHYALGHFEILEALRRLRSNGRCELLKNKELIMRSLRGHFVCLKLRENVEVLTSMLKRFLTGALGDISTSNVSDP
jgi:hypothetical protein